MEPVRVDFERGYEVDRWRVIGNIILAIPHIIILYGLQILRNVLSLVVFFTILFTQQIPDQMFNLIVMCDRYQWRVTTYTLFMRNEYPAFDFTAAEDDPGGDTASLSIDRQEQYNRWAPLYKWFLAIPHYILLAVFLIGAWFVVVISWFVVLFTGKWNDGMRDYIIKVARYGTKVFAYPLLRDEYPKFGLA
jgi:hypothetical protein